MNLHRALTHEWSAAPKNKRNSWQKLAARTNGCLTPANAVTIGGAFLVAFGLQQLVAHHYGLAIGLVLVGRLADILDGYVAEATKTKSPVGEALDALIDKLEVVLVVVVLLMTSMVPLYVLALLAAHTVIGTVISIVAQLQKRRVHPEAAGKIATALEWATIGLYIVVTATGDRHSIIKLVAEICSALFIAASVAATREYINQLRPTK